MQKDSLACLAARNNETRNETKPMPAEWTHGRHMQTMENRPYVLFDADCVGLKTKKEDVARTIGVMDGWMGWEKGKGNICVGGCCRGEKYKY